MHRSSLPRARCDARDPTTATTAPHSEAHSWNRPRGAPSAAADSPLPMRAQLSSRARRPLLRRAEPRRPHAFRARLAASPSAARVTEPHEVPAHSRLGPRGARRGCPNGNTPSNRNREVSKVVDRVCSAPWRRPCSTPSAASCSVRRKVASPIPARETQWRAPQPRRARRRRLCQWCFGRRGAD